MNQLSRPTQAYLWFLATLALPILPIWTNLNILVAIVCLLGLPYSVIRFCRTLAAAIREDAKNDGAAQPQKKTIRQTRPEGYGAQV